MAKLVLSSRLKSCLYLYIDNSKCKSLNQTIETLVFDGHLINTHLTNNELIYILTDILNNNVDDMVLSAECNLIITMLDLYNNSYIMVNKLIVNYTMLSSYMSNDLKRIIRSVGKDVYIPLYLLDTSTNINLIDLLTSGGYTVTTEPDVNTNVNTTLDAKTIRQYIKDEDITDTRLLMLLDEIG